MIAVAAVRKAFRQQAKQAWNSAGPTSVGTRRNTSLPGTP